MSRLGWKAHGLAAAVAGALLAGSAVPAEREQAAKKSEHAGTRDQHAGKGAQRAAEAGHHARKEDHDAADEAPHAAHHTIHGEEPKAPLAKGTEFLNVSPQLFVWTLGVFLGTWFVLARFAWKPILRALAEREHTVAESLAEGERVRAEAHRLLEQQDEQLARAHEQAKRLLEAARAEAARESETILAQARTEAAGAQRTAEHEIDQAKTEALDQLRDSAVQLATDAAQKIAGTQFSRDAARRLIQEVGQ